MNASNTTSKDSIRTAAFARADAYPAELTDEQLQQLRNDAQLYNEEAYDLLTKVPVKPTREVEVYALKLILRGKPSINIKGSMAIKAAWVRRAMHHAEVSPEIQNMYDGWHSAFRITHTREATPLDAWQAATVYSAFRQRWVDVEEEMPEDGRLVVFAYGDVNDPTTYKFGSGTVHEGRFYDDMQNKAGAGVSDVFIWRDLPLPELMAINKPKE